MARLSLRLKIVLLWVSANLAIAALVPFRPFEEPLILPFGKDYCGPGLSNLGAGIPVGRL